MLPAESTAKGTLLKILAPKGSTIPVLQPIAIIGNPGEDISALLSESGVVPASETPVAAEQQATEQPAEAAEVVEVAAPTAPGGRLFVSPRARKLAQERGVVLEAVKGSGPEGRIIEKDVLAYLASQPTATPLARKEAAELGVPLAAIAQPGTARDF